MAIDGQYDASSGAIGEEQANVVAYEQADGIATITLCRPDRLNAVVPELVEQVCSSLERAISAEVGAAVLTGAGSSFCAGHDLKEPERVQSLADERRHLQRVQDITRLVRRAPFPVIAAVRGYALGAGCEFALCCDLVIATRSAVFGFPEVGVGLGVTGGISHVLPVSVGLAKAKELVLTGQHFSSTTAAALGLVNKVVDDDALDTEARTLAAGLRDRPRSALALAKFSLDRGAQYGIEEAYEVEIANSMALHGGEDARKASAEFRHRSEKRNARP